jgi:hypothetical protein
MVRGGADDMQSQVSYLVRGGQDNDDLQSSASYMVRGQTDDMQSQMSYMVKANNKFDDMTSNGSYMVRGAQEESEDEMQRADAQSADQEALMESEMKMSQPEILVNSQVEGKSN